LRLFASIAVLLAALAGVLGLSVASTLREEARLLEQLEGTTRQQVRASRDALASRLDEVEQDARMLVDLIERSRAKRDFALETERPVWDGAFRALVAVVGPYRAAALVAADGEVPVLASAPSEVPAGIDELLPFMRHAAAAAVTRDASRVVPPVVLRDRTFILRAKAVKGGGAVVVASDAALFLGTIARAIGADARLFVTDPGGGVWSGCDAPTGCQRLAASEIPDGLRQSALATASAGPRAAKDLALGPAPALEISEPLARPTGAWLVTALASSEALVARERKLLARVILTAMGTALAVAAIGTVILRQQRRAATLAGRLENAEALATARETSQSIVDNAPLGVLGVSGDGRVVLANEFLTRRIGRVRVGEPLERAFSEAGRRWLADVEPLLRAAMSEGGARTTQELRGATITTESHHLHVRVVPVRDHALGVRVFALVEDQSELRELESQLVRAEKLITVGVLSAGIAHEVGSPLAVIRGRAEQLLRAASAGEARAEEDLRVIIKHIDNISSTIRQLLDFSRRQAVAPRPVALATAVARARGLLQWKLEAKGLQLEVSLEDDLPMLSADPDQLEQVLVNLLLNACDASAPASAVRVGGKGARGAVSIEVADRGSGIAPEHMNAVFDPFFTTKKRGEGTGLGLTIVAGIVRNHGGEIDLESVPGQGTRVTVIWPSVAEGKQEQNGARARG
jgi:two-component system, NtrC family, sensor histidine kinase HydH